MEINTDELFDFNIIESLKELDEPGEPSFYTELITVYLGQSPGLIDEIRNSYNMKDAEQMSKAAHTLKGSSLNVGVRKFAEICKELELKGKNNDFDNVDKLLENLDVYYLITVKELMKIASL
ncbi:MAG TPA: Hpt domain-containing protein [Ignavibacteria bacterium]|nr:Hpt domain-containing protein [Ignavibacteria bacterium]